MRSSSILVSCLALVVASAFVATSPVAGQVTGFRPMPSPAKQAFDTLTRQYQAAYDAYRDEVKRIAATPEYKKAIQAKDYRAARELRSAVKNPIPDFVARFRAALETHRDARDAAWLRGWLLPMTRDKDGTLALLEQIEAHDLEHPAIKTIVPSIPRLMRTIGADQCRGFLGQVIDRNTDKETVAAALASRMALVRFDRNATDDQKKQAEADGLLIQRLVPGTILALRADGPRFERERLQMGMTAPDIVGKDLGGVAFKLSDYRGKVVLLDFWGDW